MTDRKQSVGVSTKGRPASGAGISPGNAGRSDLVIHWGHSGGGHWDHAGNALHGRAGAVSRVDATRLQPGDIVLADRYHCQLLHRRAADGAGRRSDRGNTSAGLPTSGEADAWGDRIAVDGSSPTPAWMDAETYGSMPERLSMRETAIGGRILVTTLAMPKP